MPQPLKAMDHGIEVITITVGNEDISQTFAVHKNLICMHSEYFRKAFTCSYREGNDGHMNLPEDWPESFEVLYSWLYSGQVEAADFYTKGAISPALFWVSVYLMGDRLLVQQIQSIAFDRMTEIFNNTVQVVPNPRFIDELFSHETADSLLETYMIRHSAFWLTTSTHNDSIGWEGALKANKRFGVGVAVLIAKIVSTDWKGSKIHPCLEMKVGDRQDLEDNSDDEEERSDDWDGANTSTSHTSDGSPELSHWVPRT